MRKHTLMIRVPGFIRVPPALGGVEPYIEREHDLEKDPEEIVNLANDAKFADVKKDLRRQLDNWIKENGDQFYSYQVTEMQSSGPVMKD